MSRMDCGTVLSTATLSVVTLAWNPVTNASSYKLYQGGRSGNYTNVTSVGKTTNATVGQPYGTTDYYAVTALKSNGLESAYSTEISYTQVTDTNVYVTNTQVLYDRYGDFQGRSSMNPSNQWVNSGLGYHSRDTVGVVGGKPAFYVRLAITNSVPFATNVIIYTNPPPDTSSVQSLMMPK